MKSLIFIGFLCLSLQYSNSQEISFNELRKGFQSLADGGNEFQGYLIDNGFSFVEEDGIEAWGWDVSDDKSRYWVYIWKKSLLTGPSIVIAGSFNSLYETFECDDIESEIKDNCDYEGTEEYPPGLSEMAGKYYKSYLHKSGVYFGISIKDNTKYIRVFSGEPVTTNYYKKKPILPGLLLSLNNGIEEISAYNSQILSYVF